MLSRRAVVLPGRAYPTTLPVLATPIEVLERRGYDVRGVAWSLSALPADPAGFVEARLAEAAADGCDLVVAKSLGCWGAAHAARHRWPAIWLTPVLTEPACVAGIRANAAPQLVVVGLDDPFHDPEVAASLRCTVLRLPGVDHALSSTGDGAVAPGILASVAAAIDDFLEEIT